MPILDRSSTTTHSHRWSRRRWLGMAAGSLAATATMRPRRAEAVEPAAVVAPVHPALVVKAVDRHVVCVPYREVPARNMARELPHWRYFEVVEVRLGSGHVGFGESMLYYTWGATDDAAVARVIGKNAASLLWDDSLGSGLQIALFDAVGRALGVPAHALLGKPAREAAELSWWAIDMSPADWLAECQEAQRLGYLAFKTKGRPWFDIREQVKVLAEALPKNFKIDMDFNDTLLDAERAIPLLRELEAYPQVGIIETPIPQGDIPGNRAICEAINVPIAMHYGNPAPIVALRERVCDGFVVGGGASKLIEQNAVAEIAGLPFWLQLVGTGITAAFSLQCSAVLRQATWPSVNCHQLFTHSLLAEPITLKDGKAAIPTGPGLGFELDRDAVERFRVERPPGRPEPRRLLATSYPDGRTVYVASNGQVNFHLTQGMQGRIPYFERGAMTRLVPDDGSARWNDLWQRAQNEPVMERN